MPNNPAFPSRRMRIALWAYAALWTLAMPVVLIYLVLRGRKDRDYRRFIPERFGFYRQPKQHNAVWIHAVSLGEMRSAGPLIKQLLQNNETVLTTHFTPAGRRAAQDLFPDAIASGQLTAIYVPFELHWVYKRFFRHFQPKYGLVMEIEIWPRMIASAKSLGVPLFLCNAQYPAKSFERDQTRTSIRGELTQGLAGIMAKSQLQADRFAALGANNIAITGELRFDQPIPPDQITAGQALKHKTRPSLTIASSVEGEDELYFQTFQAVQAKAAKANLPKPILIHVPRAPERFDLIHELMNTSDQTLHRRSLALDKNLRPKSPELLAATDILLGDSMGEMYFYLSLADVVIVGGGFVDKGAHNIIEPLALGKPVLVGPSIWTIEYPATEALADEVLQKIGAPDQLADAVFTALYHPPDRSEFEKRALTFFETHSGGASKTLAALPDLLANAPLTQGR